MHKCYEWTTSRLRKNQEGAIAEMKELGSAALLTHSKVSRAKINSTAMFSNKMSDNKFNNLFFKKCSAIY